MRPRTSLVGMLTAAATLGAAALLARRARGSGRSKTLPAAKPSSASSIARQLDRAAGLLALASLTDSAIEHYRGSFHNKAMYVPIGISALSLAVNAHALPGSDDRRSRAVPVLHRMRFPRARRIVNAAAVATGFAGTGFHIYNIVKRPGGISFLNLFYAAPLGAPAALSFSGLLGAFAEHLREGRYEILGLPIGRALAGVVSIALAGTVGEAALMHYRGAYHNPAMVLPITAPPVLAAVLGRAAVGFWKSPGPLIRWMLRLVAVLGLAGTGFHVYGVHRNMGGWRNWTQNLLNGPPLPAPSSLAALGIAARAAMRMLASTHDGHGLS